MLSRVQLAVCGLLMFASAALGWQAQGWRCGRMMAEQGETRAQALVVQLQGEREQRHGLEQRLRDTESRHFKGLQRTGGKPQAGCGKSAISGRFGELSSAGWTAWSCIINKIKTKKGWI